jgi:enterochelin esterase-like enzyme
MDPDRQFSFLAPGASFNRNPLNPGLWDFLQGPKIGKIEPTRSDSTRRGYGLMRLMSLFLQSFFWTVSMLEVMSTAQQDKSPHPLPPPEPARLVSPELHADGSVTFRFHAPNAADVRLALEGAEPVSMHKDDHGVWTATAAPLAPDYYGYVFIADGVQLIDPQNPLLKPNLLGTQNLLHVPGPSLPWELNDVPRGVIHHHFYRSRVADDDRDYYVYSPPGYDPAGKKTYPVLYLLHGFSDDASGWTAVGRANVILDNLIARGQAKPMIVVMPLGYGTLQFVRLGWDAWSHKEMRDGNFENFREALLTEVMPRVEAEYRITKQPNARAIAGLSMGGSESLLAGLNNLDKFSWIGAFSSGGIPEDFKKDFPALDATANSRLHLLWIACGTEDHLITVNRSLREWLRSQGVKVTEIETPGMHTWMVWRRNLAEFARLLFR